MFLLSFVLLIVWNSLANEILNGVKQVTAELMEVEVEAMSRSAPPSPASHSSHWGPSKKHSVKTYMHREGASVFRPILFDKLFWCLVICSVKLFFVI